MNKKITLALTIIVSVFACSIANANKKDKKNKIEKVAPMQLSTPSDSLSYATGMAQTNGLMPYLVSQLGVDTAYISDFISGLKQSIADGNNPSRKSYNAGLQIGEMVKSRILPMSKSAFEGTPDSIRENSFNEGFIAGVCGDVSVYTMDEAEKTFRKKREQVENAKNAAIKKINADWLVENAKKEGVKVTPSGLQYKIITEGNGAIPKKEDKVTVKYEGKTIDDSIFDSSYSRNPNTTSFRCDQVIKGWTEALTMMPIGSKWELYIPENLAYGDRQAGKIKPYSTLIFTVELVNIEPQIVVEPQKTIVGKKAEGKGKIRK